jgi:hypothetical protein
MSASEQQANLALAPKHTTELTCRCAGNGTSLDPCCGKPAAPSTASNIRRQRAQHVVLPPSADGARASPDAQWREA